MNLKQELGFNTKPSTLIVNPLGAFSSSPWLPNNIAKEDAPISCKKN
jgi:hypothetical protein